MVPQNCEGCVAMKMLALQYLASFCQINCNNNTPYLYRAGINPSNISKVSNLCSAATIYRYSDIYRDIKVYHDMI